MNKKESSPAANIDRARIIATKMLKKNVEREMNLVAVSQRRAGENWEKQIT